MHVALLSHGLPQPSSNGGPMTCWALMRHLLESGHKVTVVALRYPRDRFASEARERVVRKQGAELVVVPVPTEPVLGGDDLGGFFPSAALVPRMRELLAELRPDAAFVYHWDTLAATHGIRAVPKLGVVGDPWHLAGLKRWQTTRPRPTLGYLRTSLSILRGIRPATRAMVALLEDCDAAACFQAATAAWLRVKGARRCEYLPSPLADPLEAGTATAPRERGSPGGRLRILVGPSRLEATSTSAGLDLFARRILPVLERELGPDGFVAHVVGEGEPPRSLARLLPRPTVLLRGRVEPADEEFLACDLQLVPTPFVFGVRLRIVSAFSFGCCVVAHRSEAANLPELEHGVNALLAPDGPGLAAAVVRAARDPELRRRLGQGARATYERSFHPRVAAQRILDRLERIAAVSAVSA